MTLNIICRLGNIVLDKYYISLNLNKVTKLHYMCISFFQNFETKLGFL